MIFCNGCAGRVKDKRGCPRCGPMETVERIPLLDGFIWFGEDTDSEDMVRRDAYLDRKSVV